MSIVWYLPRLFINARKILKYIRKEKIAVLHVNDIYNMVGCLIKLLDPSIKLVNHVRLLRNSYIAALYPFFAGCIKKYADKIICVSEAVKQDIGHAPKAEVIYDSPTVTEKYPEWQSRADSSCLKILYLGNYLPGKGHDIGLKAFSIFVKQYPGAVIRFAGAVNDAPSRKFKESLLAAARNVGIAQQVIFDGKVTDVEKEMKAHDVVVNLSQSESFSFVCLEAILFGVPLVAADSGGPAEITDYGKRAFLVPNKDYSAAANALAEIKKNPGLYAKRALEAKKWAQKKFDIIRETEKMRSIYNELFGN